MSNVGTTIMQNGRLVWTSGSDLFKGKPKLDQTTKQPRYDKLGQPMIEYGFGLAVPKNMCQEIWNAMHIEAMKLFPGAAQIPPNFAMKYKDGDGIDSKGIPYSQRAGHAGCLIFACTTTIPIKYFRFENGGNIMINEGIKNGDYVNVQINIKSHAAHGQGKAGLYLNPMAVQFLGYGEAIINAPSGDTIFGSAAPQMPQGASTMPQAPQGQGMLVPQAQPQQFGAPQFVQLSVQPQGFAQQAPQMPQAQPNFAPQAPVQPHYGVMPPQPNFQQHAPPQVPQAAPQAPPAMPGFPQMPGYPQR